MEEFIWQAKKYIKLINVKGFFDMDVMEVTEQTKELNTHMTLKKFFQRLAANHYRNPPSSAHLIEFLKKQELIEYQYMV
ncbi:hypothetical protein B5Z22_04300 [Bacillus velezensis]|nr:hypothetical protein B5Z20_09785 [Bacillus velezensis]OQV56614.1 hypothetical protein B5Z22_04300 [Bacillus velezensis]OQV63170.1 hypothetical protein B5Z24_04300 [Bacillus velezensis]OQV64093.1 hypothetical protein B5Z23_04295 [Bacillus velezensis]